MLVADESGGKHKGRGQLFMFIFRVMQDGKGILCR